MQSSRRCAGRRARRASVALVLCASLLLATACGRRSTLATALSDREFWSLIDTLSEPAGAFTLSDNVVSNEPRYAESVRWLRPSGGAFIGVGPEQNFSYIAALRPSIAFIIDIRRENLDLHLLYKALFELSTDRADFVSRLFSRPRPTDLGANASVDEIFERYDRVAPSPEQYTATAALVRERLLVSHGLPLSPADLEAIDRTFKAFRDAGPSIDYYGTRALDAVRPTYRQLMTARDLAGQGRSFLASARSFTFVKELQSRNLIVPVVGDFAGPSAMRRVGDYVRARADRIHAIYGSNVGIYLSNQQTLAFCANLATLPASPRAWFIDSSGRRSLEAKLRSCPNVAK
ncbi:MAG TPA: hypothetical protein VFJ02_21270 [Vicinamibacterales bacterium]|nr:hypothetical protein [Vicinamibacterales bacterium]